MRLPITRPDESFTDEKRVELARYLDTQWKRVQDSRQTQLDSYNRWEKNYRAIPAEAIRNVPWYKSSNLVVPLIRIFVDTFVARTLNIMFSTNPLFVVDGFPTDMKESLELYLNKKAIYEWGMYLLTRDMLARGNKNGTCVMKTTWVADSEVVVSGPMREQEVTMYLGPRTKVVPFEDFAIYPITANYLEEAEILFHQLRYAEETAKRLLATDWAAWDISTDELEGLFKEPNDMKREEQQNDAGVSNVGYRELHLVECHLRWEMQPGKFYRVVALFEPQKAKLADLYFHPYPNNWQIFSDYRPFPMEDFFYGESMCNILEGFQEENSCIHNDRRNNSYIANAPVFKRRSGSLLPNPSTNWYPGKVWDLDSMEDLDVIMIGRNYDPMLDQETFNLQLAERLSGIGAQMQGYAAGMMGKRGIYNASGTLALMSESNQRQDSNIKDARIALGAVGRTHLALQAALGASDPAVDTFDPQVADQIRQALSLSTPSRLRYSKMEVRASSAGANKEVQRQSLMQIASVLGQYGTVVQQMGMQLANPQLNPAIRAIMGQVVDMFRWMAKRLVRAFDEFDAEGVLPDVQAALASAQPEPAPGPAGPGASPFGGAAPPPPGGGPQEMSPVAGGAGQAVSPLSREGLSALLALPQASNGAPGAAGLGGA